MTRELKPGAPLRGAAKAEALARARRWRIENKPYFDAIYGPEPGDDPVSSRWIRDIATALVLFCVALALAVIIVGIAALIWWLA